ncbi:hypothetical protein ACFSKI_20325 [Pseudogracilibacillus auburnensis]|uniref:DUF4190 domain-containing protein n=1 Tax=Pseudogracilibacillus auburnensis TaxID=1494959 RepID=A0A2V3VWZ5_9BACI|nr:hypothetical protein [Pseudogracilibacillus auburnensis]MBO1003507.1 hypothetical protein [Pseudogracilibacillus auburnensis]PXW86507.1 hypothetical protein DFR56_10725 [Pseudogracilibacillus auburnensis]
MENQRLNDQRQRDRKGHPVLDDDRNLDRDFREETATEITDDDVIRKGRDRDRDRDRNDPDVQSVYGWIAVALSVISFFFIPLLFAGAGIILGFVARNREAAILGNTAIIIGVLSILIRLFILPLI